MKNSIILAIAAILFSTGLTFAQVPPQGISYQATVRDSSGQLMANDTVSMRFTIKNPNSQFPVFVEEHHPATNSNGLVSITIGTGTASYGSFSAINWANGPYEIKIETDTQGGTNYNITTTSQMMSVPYALYSSRAITADNVINYTAGMGITVSNQGVITNTQPNQQVTISGTGIASIMGAYPHYTVSTPAYSAGAGISISGGTISNAYSPVNMTGAGSSTVTGTYPNYTVNTAVPRVIYGTSAASVTSSYTISASTATIGGLTITFAQPFTNPPVVTATRNGNLYTSGTTPCVISVLGTSTTSVTIGIYTWYNNGSQPVANAPTTIPFSFIVAGD